jgi:uncharacterized protein HemX
MARNRKNQSAAVRFGPALKALLLCLFIGGSGVGYVWQQNQLLELGRQKAEKEKRLNTLRVQNSQLARHLSELQSPKSLEARVKELNLGLTLAQPTQIVRLLDAPQTPPIQPAPAPAPNRTELQYANRRSAALPVR